MKTLFLSALLVVALSVVSTAAPKSRTLLRKPLSMDTIVEVCGEPDAGYKMENVLGVSDFMLFVHSSCQYRHGAIAVVFNGEAIEPAVKIAEAIVGLYLMSAYPNGDVGVKKIKTESALSLIHI